MRANPELLQGVNVWWIKFFVLPVFATMYIRDHCRPAFHKAVGIAPDDYDFKVFRLCSEISKQTFPLTLDLDHPAFKPGFDRSSASPARSSAPKARAASGARPRRPCW